MNKWAVYDTFTEEITFRDTEEDAQRVFEETVAELEFCEEDGHRAYIFEVKKESGAH